MTNRACRCRFLLRAMMPACVALLVLVLTPRTTLAQREGGEFVDQANAKVVKSGERKSADDEWFPLIAKMAPAPAVLAKEDNASLILPGWEGWEEAAAWATAEEQKAVIDKLLAVRDYTKRFRITLPYGTEGVPQEWIDAGLNVDLGPSGLLAAARFNYLERLDDVIKLLSIEATRASDEGERDRAVDVLLAWFWLGRIVLDREFIDEKAWGMEQMHNALERMRDVAYVYNYNFEPEDFAKINSSLEKKNVLLDRVSLPAGNLLAAKQLVVRTMADRGGVVQTHFVRSLALVGAKDSPLQAFSEAAHWRDIAAGHAGFYDTNLQADKLYGDWSKRIQVESIHDTILEILSDYDLMDKRQFRLLDVTMSRVTAMLPLRLVMSTDLAATRTSLGIMSFYMEYGKYPLKPAAVVPKFLDSQPDDPFRFVPSRSGAAADRYYEFPFFVPIRDQYQDPRQPRKPHRVRVQLAAEESDAPAAATIDFADFPEDAIDMERGQVDAEKIRSYLKEKIESAPDALFAPARHLGDFEEAIADGFTGDNFKETVAKQGGGQLSSLQQIPVPGFAEYLDTVLEFMALFAHTDAMRTVIGIVRDGGEPSAEQIRKIYLEGIDAAYTAESLNRVVRQQKNLMDQLPPEVRSLVGENNLGADTLFLLPVDDFEEASPVAGSFVAELDDTTFVLYSVGPDAIAGGARIVGQDGLDILYYPSILTLKRLDIEKTRRGLPTIGDDGE